MDEAAEGSGEAFAPELVAGSQTLLPEAAEGSGEALGATLAAGPVTVVVAVAEGGGEALGASFLITLPVADFAEGAGEALAGVFAPGSVSITADAALGGGEVFTATLSASGTAVLAPGVAEGSGVALEPELRELTYVTVPDLAEGSGAAFDPVAERSAPRSPINLKAVRASGLTSVALSWTPRGGTGFKVYRSDSQRGLYTVVASPTAASYSDTSLDTAKNYAYKVTATDGASESAPSAVVFTAGNKSTL